MDSTAWEIMMTRRMRMTMMKGMSSHPPALALATVPEEIVEEEDPMENGPQELDDLDDLGDLDEDPNEGRCDMEEWFPQDQSNDRD
jgi:hypothetical protein